MNYRVGVFEHPGRRSTKLLAYLRYFNESWSGCCVHEVEAISGVEAKRLALRDHAAYHVKDLGRQLRDGGGLP